jgi:hypothetical protein
LKHTWVDLVVKVWIIDHEVQLPHLLMFLLWKMLTSAPGVLVKKSNKVRKSWNLCILHFKSIKNVTYNAKIALFNILITSAPGATLLLFVFLSHYFLLPHHHFFKKKKLSVHSQNKTAFLLHRKEFKSAISQVNESIIIN